MEFAIHFVQKKVRMKHSICEGVKGCNFQMTLEIISVVVTSADPGESDLGSITLKSN